MAGPNPNWTEIAVTTLKNRRRDLADNVLKHNALLRWLNRRGNVNLADGGETLVEELEYAENQTFKWYSHYEVLDVSPSEVFTSAEYDWKQAAVVVSISGAEMRKNSGRERMINLLDRRIRNAEKTMANNVSLGVYSDGTGSGGKQIGGLALLVANDPTTGTVGGINRANFSFWRNQTANWGATTKDDIQAKMQALWLLQVRGADKPDIWVMDPTTYSKYWQSLVQIQRIAQPQRGESGFESLEFYGPGGSASVFHDDVAPAGTAYALDTDYIFYRPHRDANMEPLAERNSFNQDAMVVPLVFMGNMTLSNAQRQGVGHSVT